MTEKTETIHCPREDCEGTVQVSLEWEPGDPRYGADSDGNRGIAVRGYWIADAAVVCSLGCVLTEQEVKSVESESENNEPDPEDDYYGPDGPEDYD